MTPPPAEISVIIPTLARPQRRALLRACLDSVHEQHGVAKRIIVVVNGGERDEALVQSLREDARLQVLVADQANLPGALRLGRSHVESPWFTAIDDDDTLLPGALALRRAALEANPDAIAVVTNGLLRGAAGDARHLASFDTVRQDPLQSMLDLNWLLPGSWLCRTGAVTEDVFIDMPQYLECTYLGLRLALIGQVVFLDEPTVAWSIDTPGSLSKSTAYALGQVDALERLMQMPVTLPARIRAGLNAKLASACHSAAALHLREGRPRAAWRSHLRCLRTGSGWRYGLFTLRLLARPQIRQTRR